MTHPDNAFLCVPACQIKSESRCSRQNDAVCPAHSQNPKTKNPTHMSFPATLWLLSTVKVGNIPPRLVSTCKNVVTALTRAYFQPGTSKQLLLADCCWTSSYDVVHMLLT
jgi:hypothetical protein